MCTPCGTAIGGGNDGAPGPDSKETVRIDGFHCKKSLGGAAGLCTPCGTAIGGGNDGALVPDSPKAVRIDGWHSNQKFAGAAGLCTPCGTAVGDDSVHCTTIAAAASEKPMHVKNSIIMSDQ